MGNRKTILLAALVLQFLFVNVYAQQKIDKVDKLADFDKYVATGVPKNATQIKQFLVGLTEENIKDFDNRHKGFTNAYTLISPNGRFKIETDWPIKDTLKTASLMDDFMEIFMTNLGVDKKDIIQCQVRLYRNPEEFYRVVASMGIGMGVGGWFRADQCMIIGFMKENPFFGHETTLIHESTHLSNFLLMRKWKNQTVMPTWLNEGLAVFFESSFLPWSDKLELGRHAFARLVGVKNKINDPTIPKDKRWSDLKTLMDTQGMIPGEAYGECWVMVHYLCYRYGDSKKKPFSEFKNFWSRVYQGKLVGNYKDFEAFVRERSKQSMPEFLEDVIAYAKELSLPTVYMADGKTKVEWELTYPDNATAEAKAQKPWYIKIKNQELMNSANEDIAAASLKQVKDGGAGGAGNAGGEELAAEYKSFFDPKKEDKLSMLELDNKTGTISFEGDFFQIDDTSGVQPSEVRLKTADTAEAVLGFRIILDKGSAGVRFGGEKGNFYSGYYLGISNGGATLTDLTGLRKALEEAKDDNARREAQNKYTTFSMVNLVLGKEYRLNVKIKDNASGIYNEENGAMIVSFKTADLKPGILALHVEPASKMRFTDLKAKKP